MMSSAFTVDGLAGAEGEIKPLNASSNVSSLVSNSETPSAVASEAAFAFSLLS